MLDNNFDIDVENEIESRRTSGLKKVALVYGCICLFGASVDYLIEAPVYLQVILLVASALSFSLSALASVSRANILKRGLVVLGSIVILSMSLGGEMVLGLTFYIPLMLFLGFVEVDESWRRGLLLFICCCFCISFYFMPSDFSTDLDGKFIFIGFLDAGIVCVLIFVIVNYFYRLNILASKVAHEVGNEATFRLSLAKSKKQELVIQNEAYLAAQFRDLEAVKTHRKKRAILSAQQEELEQFAYAASHDLKEPVRTISSFIQVVRKRLPKGMEKELKLQEYFDVVASNTKAMHELLESLLEYSRALRSSLEPEQFHVVNLLRKVLDKQTDLQVEIKADPTCLVYVDPTALVQVFEAIISNAKKFSFPEGSPAVRIEVLTKVIEEPGPDDENHTTQSVTQLKFTDNGVGIPKEYRDKVFGLFQRLHKREDYSGAGVGLTLARRLIEKSSGSISIDPTLDNGTCVIIELPTNCPSDLQVPE